MADRSTVYGAVEWCAAAVARAGGVAGRAIRRMLMGAVVLASTALGLMILGNVAFRTTPGIPERALSTQETACGDGGTEGWNVLGRPAADGRPAIGNDEWRAVDIPGEAWRRKLACVWQRHAVADYRTPDGRPQALTYDLGFVEFAEDGKPYATRTLCAEGEPACRDEKGYGRVRKRATSQLAEVLERLRAPGPHYVMVFIHGWRHDASLGDSNVGDLRHYAAHAARFLADRAAIGPDSPKPNVTAIFIGWRGARTDETWLKRASTRWLGRAVGERVGEWIGTFCAVFTLFDRKPVSEAVAPSALSALRAIERTLQITAPLSTPEGAPPPQRNRMIVFGHSLGGNMLATALEDDLVKKVERHAAGTYMLPTVGDLVVLINPASEAQKWLAVQRAVWSRLAISTGERRATAEYAASHRFFRADQRPIVISVTAARDWPPGGRTELDCETLKDPQVPESLQLVRESVAYDWATYDLFPAFKGDFRPVADWLARAATGHDPHDRCPGIAASRLWTSAMWPVAMFSRLLRVLPFMQTDPSQTRTIGHLDPPRAVRIVKGDASLPARPFGTTHELSGRPKKEVERKRDRDAAGAEIEREIPVTYDEVTGPKAACAPARGWLGKARAAQVAKRDGNGGRLYPNGTHWSSTDAGADAPSLVFQHGFRDASPWEANPSNAKLSPITRANDPFWNIRAFDTALARHDGYMLSSFICAMNQLVMDDVTSFAAPGASPSLAPVLDTDRVGAAP